MIYTKLFGAILFWSMAFYFTKIALMECSVPTLVFARCTLGLATVALFIRDFKWLKDITKMQWLKLSFLAFCGAIVQQTVQGYAIMHTSTSHAGWLIALSPVFVAAVMIMFFKEQLERSRKMGFVICILGILSIFMSKQMLSDGSTMSTSKGDFIFILTSINWVFYVVPMSIWFKNMPSIRVTFCIFLMASIFASIMEIATGGYKDLMHMHSHALGSLFYLGVFCSGLAFIFYNEGIEKIGAAKASAFLYAQPLFTTTAGYLFLGEMINRETIIGGILIMCGLYMINVRMTHVKKFYITLIRFFRV